MVRRTPFPPPGRAAPAAAPAAPWRGAVAVALTLALGVTTLGYAAAGRYRTTHIDLYSDAVALTADGLRPVPAGVRGRFVDGTRVLDDPDASEAERAAAAALALDQQAWLGSGVVPGRDTRWADMVHDALLDLHVLTRPGGGVVAGWSANWRYVWPRDAAFVTVAFARTGHLDDAEGVLVFLQSVQADDGLFQARYLPDASGVPDDRGVQVDGTGWVLWAGAQTARALPASRRQGFVDRFRPLFERSTSALLRLTDRPGDLPPPSPDYWETSTDTLTLGTAAPVMVGLESAAVLWRFAVDDERALASARAAERVRAGIARAFAPGYGRTAGGSDRDAAVAFLLPPFTDGAPRDVAHAWRAAAQEMRRPAGGLAPGGGWRRDGISWTPQTSLFALTAAHLRDREASEGWLDWLERHRTSSGALPEKVLHDGAPAAVAPLAWTAACVVLAVLALEDTG